ncbi:MULTISPECIES: hypothetical protein [Pseudomonas chlororaphis group]|jgi:hypothetical protein|uniref:Uncharacterized protein n=2 Tax=Pseudomonas chlororaphis group TaxID=136842 RepID=A0A7X1PNT1_9PSED|nr:MULTISPECIES: hypothetical protein [Pseudomonas chlororaphis group]MQA55641.1 hypothetical protein [Pseudomonas piscis]PUA44297.1 hypothetical protein C5U62_20290 [Pseudomonas protegens]
MATKTSKRAGETSTTVSVGIRIDPKMKFALDIMGRLQKRSLTAVIEWAIHNAMEREMLDEQSSLAHEIDCIWSTDEITRLVNLAERMPQALTYDELRIWETIKNSPYLWSVREGSALSPKKLNLTALREDWEELMLHIEANKTSSYIKPFLQPIPF